MIPMTSSFDVMSGAAAVPTLENLDLLNDPRVFSSFPSFFGARADAGVDVTHESVLGLPAVQQGVKILAGAMASMDVQLMQRVAVPSGKSRIEPVIGHKGDIVARNRSVRRETSSGATMSACTFRSSMMNHAIIAGDGFSAIQRNNGGEPLQTTLLPPYPHTHVEFDDSGRVIIKTTITYGPNGLHTKEFRLMPINVFQIKNLSHDGLSGYPLTEIAANALGLGLATYKYGGKSYANGTKLSGVLQDAAFPGDDIIEANVARWMAANAGLDNAGKIAYLTGGTTFEPFSMTNIDAQLVQMLDQQPKIVARLLNLPPFLLGITESSGLKMAELITFFIRFTLQDWICSWASEQRLKLLTEEEWQRGDLFFQYDTTRFLKMTFGEHVAALVQATGGPFIVPDEARDSLEMNPIEGGDKLLERSTGAPRETPDHGGSEERLKSAENMIQRLIHNGVQALAKVESQKVSAAVRKPGFPDWLDGYYAKEGRERFSCLVSEAVAKRYCTNRRDELSTLFVASGPSAVEADAGNFRARGHRIIEMELSTNGHRVHAEGARP